MANPLEIHMNSLVPMVVEQTNRGDPLLLCIVGVWQDLAAAFYLTAIVAVFFQILVIFFDLATSLITSEAS